MSDSNIRLAFKAGRAFRREGSTTVEASPTKGAIFLINGEDGLLHFQWKNRESGNIEEDLILFPSDASFSKVEQSTGRVYVLKFSSSNRRDFFWMQDASSARDDEFVTNLNGLLEDPEYEVQWSTPSSSQIQASSSSASTSVRSNDVPNSGGFHATPEQVAALSNALGNLQGTNVLSNVLQQIARNAGVGSTTNLVPPELALNDILTPANIGPLFTSHPEIIPTLFPYLPPDLPVSPSPEALQRVIRYVHALTTDLPPSERVTHCYTHLCIDLLSHLSHSNFIVPPSSPHFRAAVSSLDQGLRTGLLGGFVRSLGLPEEAGIGILPFLRAIQEQVDRERGGSGGSGGSGSSSNMETD